MKIIMTIVVLASILSMAVADGDRFPHFMSWSERYEYGSVEHLAISSAQMHVMTKTKSTMMDFKQTEIYMTSHEGNAVVYGEVTIDGTLKRYKVEMKIPKDKQDIWNLLKFEFVPYPKR
jgi:hypothetical protein